MRILVTGGAGFIGSNIVDEYIAAGHEVAVLDSLWENGGGSLSNINVQATFYHADITSQEEVTKIFREVKPQVINHHAAQHSVAISTQDPNLDAQVNILGLLNVLKSAVDVKARKLIFASSGATYGAPESMPIYEGTMQLPESPYGMTKMIGEHYIRYWRLAYGLAYTIFRYGNVYGPRQDPSGEAGVIAIFAQHFLRQEGVRIDWDGEQQKDYVYVKDVARANLKVLNGGDNDVFCIGTGRGVTVNEIYEALSRVVGWTVPITRAPKRPGDIYKAYFDPTKAERVLQWRSAVAFEEGVKATVSFLREKVQVRG
jgi:UDP-glucose 4-epimerase